MTKHPLAPLLVVAALLPLGGCDLFRGIFGNAGKPAAGSALAGTPCPDDVAVFKAQLWDPILSKTCVLCHVAGGVAAGTRMVLVNDSSDAALKANLEATKAVVGAQLDGRSLFLQKPTGRAPSHGGGTVVEPGSDNESKLVFWVGWVTGTLGQCKAPGFTPTADGHCPDDPASPRLLRRLSHFEYENTVHDLLGVDASTAESFPADPIVSGFKNNASVLTVGGLLEAQYDLAAQTFADQVIANSFQSVVGCAPADNCADAFVASFGQKAFRRPLTADEKARYTTLLKSIASDDGFAEGVKWTLVAFLQSPDFLYRQELGVKTAAGFRLTDWEVASELSYLFWQTMPDATLTQAAAAGQLRTADQIRSQALRLSMDPRAQANLLGFVNEWLELEHFESSPKDAATYPEFTAEVQADLRGEVTRMWSDLLLSGGTLADAMRSNRSFMTDRLAAFYGVPAGTGTADAQGFKPVDLSSTGYKGGVLRLGALIATVSNPNQSSPIRRGKLVRERLLCQDLPPPPQNLNISPPKVDPTLTTRERFAAHETQAACKSCHQLMDPIGFGFEPYDGVGRFRSNEGGKPIDASGEIVQATDAQGKFVGLDGLANALAGTHDLDNCYAKMWFAFGTGVAKGEAFNCNTTNLALDNPSDGASLTAHQLALTKLAQFIKRTGEAAELDGPAAEGSVPFSAADLQGAGPPVVVTPPNSPPPPAPSTGTTGATGNTSTGATGSAATPPQPAVPPTTTVSGLSLTLQEDSHWDTGYCVKGMVTNGTSADQEWHLAAPVQGTITSIWNATATPQGSSMLFSGIDTWNKVVPKGQTLAAFGFCAKL